MKFWNTDENDLFETELLFKMLSCWIPKGNLMQYIFFVLHQVKDTVIGESNDW